jgi:formamidopyrimidine-DNA glycosylase
MTMSHVAPATLARKSREHDFKTFSPSCLFSSPLPCPTLPELPEVETMRRGVLTVIGSRIARTLRPPCQKRPITFTPSLDVFDRRIRDRTIADIIRRGKRVMLILDDQQTIVIEPRMTGLVLLADPPTWEHLRLQIDLQGGDHDRVLFWDRRGLGTVRLYHGHEVASAIDDKLGPDALAIDGEILRTRLGSSRRAIKVALLDQSAVAGIGNLYAAEILFLSGVDPRAACHRLTLPQWIRIADATRKVLEQAIQHEGSTLGDGTYRNALNDPGGYQNYHRVYDREEETCVRCKEGKIRRIVQAQRSTFFCPVCQLRRGLDPRV